MTRIDQPALILGGFLIGTEAYRPMAERLETRIGHPAPTRRSVASPAVRATAWCR
ncbi:MAG: hypothetical protein ACKO7Z_08675 [Cyanobacteriota bacterium]